jgi:preprotein translocase subunit Sec61beta
MGEKKAQMPQSTAGLMRYYDSDKASIKISPKAIIAVALSFSLFVAILNLIA